MAVRLSVVMVHSPPPSASAQQLAEAVVGELIGRPGIDLTLVGPLANLSATSTDRLTLESLSGDVAVLDWQDPAEIVEAFAGVGLVGIRTPHTHDPDLAAPTQPGRRIYAFDLNGFRDGQALCSAITQLNSSRQIRTFSLSLGPTSDKPASNNTTKTVIPEAPQAGDRSGPPRVAAGNASVHPKMATAAPQEASALPQSTAPLDLDDLLDKLDDLDP